MSKDGCVISVFNWSESGRNEKGWEQLGTQTPACHDSHSHMRMWEARQVGGQKDNGLGHFCFPFGLCYLWNISQESMPAELVRAIVNLTQT